MIKADRNASYVRRLFDEQWALLYRQVDDLACDDAFEHYGALVTALSSSFRRPIDVLDIGCGTGRYLHCVRNARRLVGLDLSPHMLVQARSPLHGVKIRADSVDFICGDLESAAFVEASFDFAYSVGVFGEYSPLDDKLLCLCLRVLRPGGILFVTSVDTLSRVSVPENERASLLRRIARKVWPLLPAPLRVVLNLYLSPFYVGRSRLDELLAISGISNVKITSYVHRSGWLGTHFDCVIVKDGGCP